MHLAARATGVLDRAFAQGEQGIVLAAAYIFTGVEMRTTLTNEDDARTDVLTGKALAAKTLGFGIATVADGTLTFLVCHFIPSFTLR